VISMGTELEWHNWVVDAVEGWVDFNGSAEGFPVEPSVVCCGSMLVGDPQGDISLYNLE
jgi:hypothetical protein